MSTRRPASSVSTQNARSCDGPRWNSADVSTERQPAAMKAVVLRAPGDVAVEDVPDPELRDEGDAIVAVRATAICGADLFPFHGLTPGFEPGTILGHEFGGEVAVVGCDRVAFRPVLGALGTANRVVAVDAVRPRRELAARLGAEPLAPDEAADALSAGADVVIEAAGSPAALDAALRLARG